MPSPITFSQEAIKANLQSQRDLADLLPVLDKASECGVDVTGYRAIANGLKEQLEAVQRNFMQQPAIGG